MSYRASVRCDAPKCISEIFGEGPSRELAQTDALANARANGWAIAQDRLHDNRDMCPAHRSQR